MSYFIITFVVMLIFILAMSIGVILNNKALKGSCGGLGKIMGEKCQFCEKKGECQNKKNHEEAV